MYPSNNVASILEAVAAIAGVLNVTTKRSSRIEEVVSMLKTDITCTEAVANKKSMSDVLDIIKMDITTYIKEMRINISSEMNIINHKCSRIEELLQSIITDTLENLKTNGKKMNDTCSKDDIEKLRTQLMGSFESEHPTTCKEIMKACGCKLDVYGLSLLQKGFQLRKDAIEVFEPRCEKTGLRGF